MNNFNNKTSNVTGAEQGDVWVIKSNGERERFSLSKLRRSLTRSGADDETISHIIDHIIPVSVFNLVLESDQLKCFHYSNLQPLWAKENKEKATNIQLGFNYKNI